MVLWPINWNLFDSPVKTTTSTTKADTGYFSNGYQPNRISGQKLSKSGKTIKDTGLKGSKNMNGSLMDNQAIWTTPSGLMYIWVGADGKSTYNDLDGSDVYGYYQLVGEDGKLYDNLSSVDFSGADYAGQFASSPWHESQANLWERPTVTETPKKPTSNTGGGTDPVINELLGRLDKQNALIDDYAKRLEEALKPKVYTARELADQYDISDLYNTAYWNNIYDQATNEYYDNAVREQNKLRTDYAYQNSLYMDNLVNDYLKSYNNAAPTAASRGAMAASALSAQALQDVTNSNNDYGMLSSVNQLEQDRLAELAKNKNEALTTYQNLGTYLMNLGADHNKSDVTDYTNTLNNISTKYTADRAYSQSLANAAASRYAGLAQAAGTKASSAANSYNNSAYQQLWNLYKNVYGDQANTAYIKSAGYKI